MSKKFELNRNGVAELMKSPAMIELLRDKARGIQEAAGDGYEVSSFVGTNRANVSVKTKTKKSIRDNNKNNTLLKAMR